MKIHADINNKIKGMKLIPIEVLLRYRHHLKTGFDVVEKVVPGDVAFNHQQDFYGLLNRMGVDGGLYYPTLILNGYSDQASYEGHNYIKIYDDEAEVLKFLNTLASIRVKNVT